MDVCRMFEFIKKRGETGSMNLWQPPKWQVPKPDSRWKMMNLNK